MVARNFSVQDLSYSRLLRVPDDENEFLTFEELKSSDIQQSLVQPDYQSNYYELPSLVE